MCDEVVYKQIELFFMLLTRGHAKAPCHPVIIEGQREVCMVASCPTGECSYTLVCLPVATSSVLQSSAGALNGFVGISLDDWELGALTEKEKE